MTDTQRKALTACMEQAYNFAQADYISEGMINDEALQESMKAVLNHSGNLIQLMDFTKMMIKQSSVLIPANMLQNFMDTGKF